jgi:hypothetical protein
MQAIRSICIDPEQQPVNWINSVAAILGCSNLVVQGRRADKKQTRTCCQLPMRTVLGNLKRNDIDTASFNGYVPSVG